MIQVYSQNVKGTWLALACNEQKIVASTFADNDQKALSNLLNSLPFNEPFEVSNKSSTCAKDTFALMASILEGKDVTLNINLETSKLPKYTHQVLKAVLQIPVGYITTYGSIAKAIGGGARAVGNVMACNNFAPLVPCHRVVKSDFSLGGYAGGLKTKYQLLTKEKKGYLEPKCVEVDSGAMQVFPVEWTLKKVCLP